MQSIEITKYLQMNEVKTIGFYLAYKIVICNFWEVEIVNE